MNARSGANIHHIIGGADGILVMLHNNEGIAEVTQPLQGGKQLVVITLVQSDAGFVQNIKHTGEI